MLRRFFLQDAFPKKGLRELFSGIRLVFVGCATEFTSINDFSMVSNSLPPFSCIHQQ